jgi:hypothetical protein
MNAYFCRYSAANQLVHGIGAIIDHNKGTAYDYPDQLQVKMGESVVIDKKATAQQTAQKACASEQQC